MNPCLQTVLRYILVMAQNLNASLNFAKFYNPELGLYMDDALFGGAVPAFSPLRIQRNYRISLRRFH